MCWGFFQAALECALKERAGSVGLAGFVSGYSLDIFRNYEKIDKITAPVRTAQRLGKERCQKDCADHDRSGIWSEPIVKLPRVLVREQFHAWEKFFPACLRGVVFFFLCLASSSSAESAKHIHWEHIQNIHRFFSSAASTHLFAGASSDLSSRLIYHQTVGLCGPNRGSVCHACKGFSVRPSVCSSYNLWSSKSPLSTYISGPESIKTCLLVFSPKLASLTGKISVRLLGTLIEPFAGVQRWTEDDEFSQMIGNEAYQIKNMQSSLKDFVRIVRARDGICTLIRKSHCSLPAHAPWN